MLRTNGKEVYTSVQKKLNKENRKEKELHKKKVENYVTCNNMRRVWNGMKLMSSYVNGNTQKFQQTLPMNPMN